MLSWRSRSKTTIQAFCNANLSFHRNACSRSLRDCSACRRAKSDKRLGSHLVYRQRSRGTRPGCLCDDQPTGYNIYQFRKRIPLTNVRWIYFGRVQNSDRSATHHDPRENHQHYRHNPTSRREARDRDRIGRSDQGLGIYSGRVIAGCF